MASSLQTHLDALGHLLSANARINLPESPEFAGSSARWSELGGPKPGAVIMAATEDDVVAAIRWAAEREVPLVGRAGGHGWQTRDVGRGGVVLNLRLLNSVTVDKEAMTAVIGGGAVVREVLKYVSSLSCAFFHGRAITEWLFRVAKANNVHISTCNPLFPGPFT